MKFSLFGLYIYIYIFSTHVFRPSRPKMTTMMPKYLNLTWVKSFQDVFKNKINILFPPYYQFIIYIRICDDTNCAATRGRYVAGLETENIRWYQ